MKRCRHGLLVECGGGGGGTEGAWLFKGEGLFFVCAAAQNLHLTAGPRPVILALAGKLMTGDCYCVVWFEAIMYFKCRPPYIYMQFLDSQDGRPHSYQM